MLQNKIVLQKCFFTEKEKAFLENGELKVSVFKYSSGIEALTVRNKKGYITVLPYKGQQIWRAGFMGHELVMHSMFNEPTDSDDFLHTYGAFLIHCGLTAIGNPSENDTHPLHGELPNAHYSSACIISGEDERGKYIDISGEYDYRIGFDSGYRFVPVIRLYEDASTVKVTVNLINLRGTPQEYLYLCHINFRPVDGSRLIYSGKKENIFIHRVIPDNMPEDKKQKLTEYLDTLKENISIHDSIDKQSQFYQPEIVFTVKYEADEDGKGHCLQLMPDGYASYVSHKPEQLPYGIRWISRTEDEDALGMLLPATGEHNGYLDCREKGYIRQIPPRGVVTMDFEAGLLDPKAASEIVEKIEKTVK